jgi:hypothetical protein
MRGEHFWETTLEHLDMKSLSPVGRSAKGIGEKEWAGGT